MHKKCVNAKRVNVATDEEFNKKISPHVVENFLAKHLGGRAEEFEEVEGATARFPLLEKEGNKVEEVAS